jgi:putative DNA primase/helicase
MDDTMINESQPESTNVPSSDEAKQALTTITNFLEPIPFTVAKNDGMYEKFLYQWKQHIIKKLADPTLTFDSGKELGKSYEQEDVKQEKVSKSDYKVVTTDVFRMTAKLLGHPISYHGDKLYVYSGKCWQPINDSDLNHYLRNLGIKVGVSRLLAPDVDFIEKLKKQIGSTTSTQVKGMARNLINFQNGTLEFKVTGEVHLREHRPEDQLLYVLPYEYDPTATCSKWQQFLDEVISEEGKQESLAEFLGSCFSDVKHEKILLLYGTGANGKSVVMEVITQLFGKNNLTNNSLEEITDSKGYYRGNLMSSLLNYAGEISKKVNPDGLKKLASREPMMGRYVWGRPFEVTDYCRSAFNCNVLPEITDNSDGFFRRFLIIPFDYTVPVEKRNPNLPNEIGQTDLPGIMNWVITGLQRLIMAQGRFTKCPASEATLNQYRDSSMNVELFAKDIFNSNVKEYQATALYHQYISFCFEREYSQVNTKQFSSGLLKAGFRKIRRNDGVYYCVG